MLSATNKNYIKFGLITAIISFLLLIVGINLVIGNEISTRNILVYIGFSFIAGIITFLLAIFRTKIAFYSFLIGLFIGFFEMYRAFLSEMTGWGDLIGIISLFLWTGVGLIAGLIFQLAHYLIIKHRK